MTVKNKMVLPPIPKHQHYVIITKSIISHVLQNAFEKTCTGRWQGIRGTNNTSRELDLLILEYNKKSALEGKELDCIPCGYCQQPIYEGDTCLSKRRSNSNTGHYHISCAKKIHILV